MYPAFAELPLTGRYVDNMGASKATMEELKQLVRDLEVVFKKVKISCKGWTLDGEDPPKEVSGAEPSIGVCVSIRRFGRVRRGRLDEDVLQSSGGFRIIDSFLPSKLSLR